MQILGVDLDQGDIGLFIAAHNSGVERAVVVEGYLQFLSTVNHVVVGDDISVRADNHARAHTTGLRLAFLLLLLLFALTLSLALSLTVAGSEEPFERVKEVPSIHALLGCGVALDAHDAVDGVLGHVGEVAAQVHGATRGADKPVVAAVGRLAFLVQYICVSNDTFLL